jgi:hypothetical protein
MSPQTGGEGRAIKSFGIEIVFALLLAALGGVAIVDSLRLGAGWAADGPKAGFFPFWIGVCLSAAALVVLVQALLKRSDAVFAHTHELKLVGAIAIPTALFIVAIPFLGIYVAGALLIAGFLRRLGRYSWLLSAGAAAALMVGFFIVFEIWFLVSMPKGPLETALGF